MNEDVVSALRGIEEAILNARRAAWIELPSGLRLNMAMVANIMPWENGEDDDDCLRIAFADNSVTNDHVVDGDDARVLLQYINRIAEVIR